MSPSKEASDTQTYRPGETVTRFISDTANFSRGACACLSCRARRTARRWRRTRICSAPSRQHRPPRPRRSSPPYAGLSAQRQLQVACAHRHFEHRGTDRVWFIPQCQPFAGQASQAPARLAPHRRRQTLETIQGILIELKHDGSGSLVSPRHSMQRPTHIDPPTRCQIELGVRRHHGDQRLLHPRHDPFHTQLPFPLARTKGLPAIACPTRSRAILERQDTPSDRWYPSIVWWLIQAPAHRSPRTRPATSTLKVGDRSSEACVHGLLRRRRNDAPFARSLEAQSLTKRNNSDSLRRGMATSAVSRGR